MVISYQTSLLLASHVIISVKRRPFAAICCLTDNKSKGSESELSVWMPLIIIIIMIIISNACFYI